MTGNDLARNRPIVMRNTAPSDEPHWRDIVRRDDMQSRREEYVQRHLGITFVVRGAPSSKKRFVEDALWRGMSY